MMEDDNLDLQNEDVVVPKTRKPRKVNNDDKPKKPPGRPRLPSPPPLPIIPKPPRINKTDDPNYQKNYYYEKRAYNVTCEYCSSTLLFAQIDRHVRSNKGCRMKRMNDYISQLEKENQELKQNEPNVCC